MFSDVSVITNEATDDLDRHGNFTVIFSSGVGVIIAEQKRRLHVKISLPPQHKVKPYTSYYTCTISEYVLCLFFKRLFGKGRAGLKPIGPIVPNWAPRLRVPALECNLLLSCQVHTCTDFGAS